MSKTNLTPIIESYNTDEEFLYSKTYLFIKGFAIGRNLKYTLKALPFARKIHNGQYRKGIVTIDGKEYRLPYVLHVLKVASTLISLSLPLDNDELDMLICVALLHDSIEDAEDGFFKNDGHELVSDYGFPEEVYKTIRLLSKRSGATEAELNAYFNEIKKDKIALLVKMADRSHNVEDLYNMKNIPKYIQETKDYFLGGKKNLGSIVSYGKQNYPELSNALVVLKSKILSLTEEAEVMYNKQLAIIEEKDAIIKAKDEEIARLKKLLEEKNK